MQLGISAKTQRKKKMSLLQLWLPGSHLPLWVVVSRELSLGTEGTCLLAAGYT